MLVVVYLRAGVRAVVAVLSALLLAFCYRVACYLLAVALLVACWRWRGGPGRACVAAGGGLLLACCWRAGRVVAGCGL